VSRVLAVLWWLVILFAVPPANSAHAQTAPSTEGAFSYEPTSAPRGGTINITGKCLFNGSANGVRLFVGANHQTSGPDSYNFTREFTPNSDGTVAGTLPVPADAVVGDYIIFGSCTAGDQIFFTDRGPFAVTGTGSSNDPPPTSPPLVSRTTVAPRRDTRPPRVIARTGPDLGLVTGVGLTLIGGGLLLTVALRRSRLR
jgi:hypothetical protein